MAAPGPLTLLSLLLLLAVIFPHQTASDNIHQCLHQNNVVLRCAEGQVILVGSAFLGVSEGPKPYTANCPKTSDKCHWYITVRVSQVCSRKQTCFLVNQGTPVIKVHLQNGCGLINYIEVEYTCTQVSTIINICKWSGESGPGSSYIVNEHYPKAISQQPHRCQCTIQKHPDSTTPIGVTLIMKDAYFTGSSCQQKLYVEFPGHSTQNSTVCSSSQRVTGRTLLSRYSIENSEIIALLFDKVSLIADAGTFVIEVQVTGTVAIGCTTLEQQSITATPETVPPQKSSPLSTYHIISSTNSNQPASFESTTASPQHRSDWPSNTAESTPQYHHSRAEWNRNDQRMYILSGLALGGVALILVVLSVILVRSRKRKNHQMPTEADQSAVDDSCMHSENNLDHEHNDGQLTDSLQIYAVIPDLVISVAKHKEVKETPNQAASGMDNTAFAFQTANPTLPTETYAIVDKSKKNETRAEAFPIPVDHSEQDKLNEKHRGMARGVNEDTFTIHTADSNVLADTYAIVDKIKKTHARPEAAHDSPADCSEKEKLNEYHPELAPGMEATTFTIHTTGSTLPTDTYVVVDRNQHTQTRAEAYRENDNKKGEINSNQREVASEINTTTLVSQTTDPSPPTEAYAVEDKVKETTATMEAALSLDDFAKEENLQMNNPQETFSLIEQTTTTVQMLTEPYAVVDITNVASQAANVQEEENLQMYNPQETSSIMEQPTITVQMLTEPYAVVDITNIATQAAHVQDNHRRVDHQRENMVAPESLAAAVIEDPVYEAIEWREGSPGKDSGRGGQDNESYSSEETIPSSSQASLVAQVEDDSGPHNTM